MRAIVLTAYGGLEGFREEMWPLPPLRAHQVRVRIRAAAFNPEDSYWRRGHQGLPLPFVLGRDIAGEVDAVGEAVTVFRPGDLRIPGRHDGRFRAHVTDRSEGT